MRVRKIASLFTLLVLVFILSPGLVRAEEHGEFEMSGTVEDVMQTGLVPVISAPPTGPELAEGNHIKWIDRIANLPDYCRDFYHWLENNISATGALVDPPENEIYDLVTVTDSMDFTYSETDNIQNRVTNVLTNEYVDILIKINDYADDVYRAFHNDHPEVFWLTRSLKLSSKTDYHYSTNGDGTGTIYYTFDFSYVIRKGDYDIRAEKYRDPAKIIADIQLREECIESILAYCPPEGVFDQIYIINERLTKINAYNPNISTHDYAPLANECLSALMGADGREGPVCEGYALAFKVLCDRLDIPCVMVGGSVLGATEKHAWNYVSICGKWYAVDVTWNDPFIARDPLAKESGYETDKWLLRGANSIMSATQQTTFIEGHIPEGYVNGPVLSDEAYDGTHNYQELVKKPTCTGTGYLIYACPCGANYIGENLPATGHSYKNGTCTVCGEADPDYVPSLVQPTISVKYPSLSFEDVIIMNVYYTAANLEDVVEMGLITNTVKPEVVGVETADAVIPGYGVDGSFYFSSTEGIAPKDLGDTIYFAVYAKLADGTYTYTTMIGYSPKTYALNQLTTGSVEMRPLVAAMLNYGAAAQNYFSYKTDSLVNATMTEEQKAMAESYRDDMIASVTQASGDKLGQFVSDKTYSKRYPTITFEGAFCINYYFQPTLPVEGDVTMYIWSLEDYNAVDVLTKENATKTAKMELAENGEYLGVVDGIAAKDLDKAAYVSFVYNDGTTEHCGGVIAYTIGMYGKSQAAGTGNLAELAKACAVYGYYAKQLFNK